ncbi:MAG: sensor histidine kinase [Bacteroidetes bacterium]|nr:sensor histidine kinase [Bacteroidota bacterium]MBS1975470.1 sensor histidine kinase [Bacteroidota bacterium]
MVTNNSHFFDAIVILAILIGIILIYFIVTIISYHRRYIKLQKERIFAEITMQENERRRIANDLHDSLGPLLSSVKLNINSIDISNKQDEEIISRASKRIDEIIKSMRQISYNLLPNTLQRNGLNEALREFVKDIQSRHNMQVHLYFPKEVSFAKEKEIHVFRIVQEMLHNVLKHANAKNLYISITEENGNLQVMVKDDGRGFDLEKSKKESKGLGLKSLESRIEMLNGQLNFESFPNKGASYFLKLPLQ